jgi:hypothetical protein
MPAKQRSGASTQKGSGGKGGGEEPSKIKSVFNAVKTYELFAFRPSPQMKGQYYGSAIGIVASLVVLVIIIAYIVITFQRFLEGNITVVIKTDKTSMRVPAVPFSLSLPHLNNQSYFSLSVQHRTVGVFGRGVSSRVNVPLQTTVDPDTGIPLVYANVSNVPPMYGNCQTEACAYVRIKVLPCSNDTIPPDGSITCAPFDEINAIVNSNYMRMSLDLREEGEELTRLLDVSLKTAFSFRRQLQFDVLYTANRPDYLRTYKSVKFWEPQLSNDVFTIDRIPRLTSGPDTEMCKIDLEMTGVIVAKQNKPQTSLDLIGQWAAFYGAIFGTVSFFVIRYNMSSFYSECPGWDNFDEEFKRRRKDGGDGEDGRDMTVNLDADDNRAYYDVGGGGGGGRGASPSSNSALESPKKQGPYGGGGGNPSGAGYGSGASNGYGHGQESGGQASNNKPAANGYTLQARPANEARTPTKTNGNANGTTTAYSQPSSGNTIPPPPAGRSPQPHVETADIEFEMGEV